MFVRKHREFSFEALERRETPSTGLGGLHHLAAHARAIPLNGSGTVDYTSLTNGTVTLHTRSLGTLTGTVVVTGSNTLTADLSGGTTVLDLALQGTFTTGKVPHFRGTFTVLSGSQVNGAAVGGSGNVNGTVSTSTHTLNFGINGRLTR